MAQNVTIAGATYNDVPSIVVPKSSSGDAIFVDPTPTTATAVDVVFGKQFLSENGILTTGSAVIPEPATATPLMDGTAAVGSSTKYAKEDHIHPSNTNKQDTLVSGTNIKTINNISLLGSGNINTLPQTTSLTIAYSNWNGNGPYTQTVTISGATITSDTKVDIQPDATAITQMIYDGVLALYITNNNGTLTLTAVGAATTANITVQVTYYKTA